MPEIYQPAEDSYLLSKVLKKQIPKLLKKNKNLKFLEIGCGSGINLKTASDLGIKKQNIFSCDINPKAVEYCKNLGYNSVKSDLFKNIGDVQFSSEAIEEIAQPQRKGRLRRATLRNNIAKLNLKNPSRVRSKGNHRCPRKFNIIIFNPPYLPKDKNEPKESQTATTGGKKGNEIILKFLKQAKNHLETKGIIYLITSSLTPKIDFKKLGYKSKEIGCKKLFFEKLYIWELVI